MRPAAFLVCALLLGSCAYSLEDDMADLRTEMKEIEARIPPLAPLWIYEGPDRFDQFIQDYTQGFPDFIYRHLVRKLHAMPAEEIESQTEGALNVEAVAGSPSPYRGKFWRATGVIGLLRARQIKDADMPVAMTHEGVFFDRQNRPILFHVVEKPDVLTLREDLVEVRGLFVKMVEFETRSGRRASAPFLVGKVLRRFL